MSRSRSWLLILALFVGVPALAEEPAAVEQRIRQRLAKKPDDTDIRFELARTLARQNKFKAAIAEYVHLLKKYPDNPDYLLGMAQVKLWSEQPKEALPLLAQARQLSPRYIDVWRTEIQARLALGDDSGGRALRDEARQHFPAVDWTFAQIDAPAATLSPTAAEPVAAERIPTAVETTQVSPAASPVVAPASPTPAPVVLPAQGRTAIEAGISHEQLTRRLPSWRSRYVLGEHRTATDTVLYGGLRETDRYASVDFEVHAGIGLPLTSAIHFQVEAGTSSTHHILPARYGALQLQVQPAVGWTLTGGWRRSTYDLGMTGIVHLGADRYLGNERFSYTLYSGGPDGSNSVPSHRLQWAHYYGERNWAGIAFNTGRETENLGTGGFLTTRVQGLNLAGRHGLDNNWSLAWEAGRVRQGDAYTRRGLRLGLRYSF